MRWWNPLRLEYAAMLADVRPGKKIVIHRRGLRPDMTLQACKCHRATNIAVVDNDLWKRLAMAERLGATTVINGAKEDTGSLPASSPTIWAPILCLKRRFAVTTQQAPYLVMRGRKIMIVGTVAGDSAINFLKINREVSIRQYSTLPTAIR